MNTSSIIQRSAFDSWKIASPLSRILSFLVDGILVLIVVFTLAYFTGYLENQKAFILFWIIGMWFWEATWVTFIATSPGKKLLGLEIYSPRTDGVPSPQQISIRIFMFWAGILLVGIGLTPILQRKDRRGWHDLISETLVMGKHRSIPSNASISTAGYIILLQSLILFSGTSAFFYSKALHLNRKGATVDKCYDTQILLSNPTESLFAMTVSPAWQDCWRAIRTQTKSVYDSRYLQILDVARKYNSMLAMPKEFRKEFYDKELQKSEASLCTTKSLECATAQELKNIFFSPDTKVEIDKNYLSDFKTFLIAYAAADSVNTQLEALDSLLQLNPTPIVELAASDAKSALELVTSDRHPSFVSMNPTWNENQRCFWRILKLDRGAGCDREVRFLDAINDLQDDNTVSMENLIASEEMDPLYFYAKSIYDYKTGIDNGQVEAAKWIYNFFPRNHVFFSYLDKIQKLASAKQ